MSPKVKPFRVRPGPTVPVGTVIVSEVSGPIVAVVKFHV
jgi:hypothetical protein